jgi:hypothetical protein
MALRPDWNGRAKQFACFWTMQRGAGRRVRCAGYSHPHGMELRIDRDGEVLKSEVCRTWSTLAVTVREWRASFEAQGWRLEVRPAG